MIAEKRKLFFSFLLPAHIAACTAQATCYHLAGSLWPSQLFSVQNEYL